MFTCHWKVGVFGAGPAENRVNAASPWNWGHSYWFRLLSVFADTEIAVKIDENINAARKIVIGIFLFITVYPHSGIWAGCTLF